MRLVLMTTMYERHKLTDFVFSYYNDLKEKVKDRVELILLVAGSEGDVSRNIAEKNSFNYIETPNFPLSKKHNTVLQKAKEYNPDGVILIGSDDLICENIINFYVDCINEDVEYAGFQDFYILDEKLYYWGGYTNERRGEPIGAGRLYSKVILNQMDWDLWGARDINKGLDSLANEKISFFSPRKKVITLNNIDGFMVDIKTKTNITKTKDTKGLILSDYSLLHKLDIDIDELSNIVELTGVAKKSLLDLSIIISTYNNEKYIEECLNSIIKSIGGLNVEVLLGVDSCKKTLEVINKMKLPDYIRVFFFEENHGPYIVFNTLSKKSIAKNLMFFGSDDVMLKNMVGDALSEIGKFDCIRCKYINFNDGEEMKSNNASHEGGVFMIKKEIFDYLNGYEPWICEGDSDFVTRLIKNKYKIKNTKNVNFFRRIHKNGLTSRQDTGYDSQLRKSYRTILRSKVNFGPLQTMVTKPCVTIKDNINIFEFDLNKKNVTVENKLDGIFNRVQGSVEESNISRKTPDNQNGFVTISQTARKVTEKKKQTNIHQDIGKFKF